MQIMIYGRHPMVAVTFMCDFWPLSLPSYFNAYILTIVFLSAQLLGRDFQDNFLLVRGGNCTQNGTIAFWQITPIRKEKLIFTFPILSPETFQSVGWKSCSRKYDNLQVSTYLRQTTKVMTKRAADLFSYSDKTTPFGVWGQNLVLYGIFCPLDTKFWVLKVKWWKLWLGHDSKSTGCYRSKELNPITLCPFRSKSSFYGLLRGPLGLRFRQELTNWPHSTLCKGVFREMTLVWNLQLSTLILNT